MSSFSPWQIDGSMARLRLTQFSAQVDFIRPAAGLHSIVIAEKPQAGQSWLGVELAGETPTISEIDAYVRGSDLIVTYAETATRPLRAQLYWRAIESLPQGALASVELVASVQTSLLDACPRLSAQSFVAAGELVPLGESAETIAGSDSLERAARGLLIRPAGANYSCADIITGGTRDDDRVDSTGGRVHIVHDLFADRLEKGVILRTRIRSVLVARDADLSAANAELEDFLATALPLTT
jgi:hypothetical protein